MSYFARALYKQSVGILWLYSVDGRSWAKEGIASKDQVKKALEEAGLEAIECRFEK